MITPNTLNKKLRIRLILLLFSLTLSLVVVFIFAETLIRIQRLGVSDGLQSYFRVIVPNEVISVRSWVISDEDLGFRLNPKEEDVNDYSMRDRAVPIQKSSLKRVFILGDSIPFFGSPSIIDLLKSNSSYKNVAEIYNAATPGYTTYQELLHLKKFLIHARPDIVVLVYSTNDNHKFLHRFDNQANMLWTDEAKQDLAATNAVTRFISKSYFLTLLRQKFIGNSILYRQNQSEYPWEAATDINTAWKQYSWAQTSSCLEQMNALLVENNGKLLVVYVPHESQFDSKLLQKNRQYVFTPQEELRKITNKLGVPFLDLYPYFSKKMSLGEKLYTDGLHLTQQGIFVSTEYINTFLLMNL